MKKHIASAIAALGFVAAVLPASATTVIGTFSGIVAGGNGIDEANLFGFGAGADLSGDTITGTFSYDSTGFPNVEVAGGTSNTSWVLNAAVPPLTITETIDGYSMVFADTTESTVGVTQDASDRAFVVFIKTSSGALIDVNADVVGINPSDLAPNIAANINDIGSVSFDLATLAHYGINTSQGYIAQPGYDEFIFRVTSFQAGVPEPATWAMMLVGFFGVGTTIRRQNKIAVAA